MNLHYIVKNIYAQNVCMLFNFTLKSKTWKKISPCLMYMLDCSQFNLPKLCRHVLKRICPSRKLFDFSAWGYFSRERNQTNLAPIQIETIHIVCVIQYYAWNNPCPSFLCPAFKSPGGKTQSAFTFLVCNPDIHRACIVVFINLHRYASVALRWFTY